MNENGEEFVPPFRKKYFSMAMVNKYEPLNNAMERVSLSEGNDEDSWDEYQYHLGRFNRFEWGSNWDGITYDIVFYGVSGYTGYLMMEYLKRVSLKRNPEIFTFAFAGRTRAKVQEMRDREFAGTEWEDTPILQMSYDDMWSIIDLVKSARVIVNVAGPYLLAQGELMVDACICMGRHYCDISGEIPWTCRLLDLHQYAKKGGSYIIPSAASAGGYPDLGVFSCAKKLREEYNDEIRHAICYCGGGGAAAGSSGGTLATRAAMNQASEATRMKMADIFSLGGFIPSRDRWGIKNVTIESGTGKVNCKTRSEDIDANMTKVTQCPKTGVFRGPFVYSYFDTRIVRRSNMLFAEFGSPIYGKNLNFLEYGMIPEEDLFAPQPAAPPTDGGGGGGGSTGGGVSVEAERAALEAQGKYFKQGDGPRLEQLDDAWTGYFIYCESEKGHEYRMSMIGRDGYFETARVAVETAMCCRFDADQLPYKGGVLTPTVACGEFLLKRVINAGMKYQMGSWHEKSERRPPPNP